MWPSASGTAESKKKILLYDPLQKVDADGLLVVAGEDAFAEPLDHAGFADGAVTHDHHLKEEQKRTEKCLIVSLRMTMRAHRSRIFLPASRLLRRLPTADAAAAKTQTARHQMFSGARPSPQNEEALVLYFLILTFAVPRIPFIKSTGHTEAQYYDRTIIATTSSSKPAAPDASRFIGSFHFPFVSLIFLLACNSPFIHPVRDSFESSYSVVVFH